MFGVAPTTAVGTDLWFAGITKAVGGSIHHRLGGADLAIVRRLCFGSLPAALLTGWFVLGTHGHQIKSGLIMDALGVVLLLTAIATPGHTPGALSWHWGSCDSGVCLRMVYADSLTPIGGAAYRFSDHPDYVAAYRAGLKKLADTECDILMTPHPSASNMLQRMSGKAPLRDGNACRDYAAKQEKALDEQLAKEQAR